MEILLPYVLNARHIIDEYHVWLNTSEPADVAFIRDLEGTAQGFVRLVPPSIIPNGRTTVYQFYEHCTAVDTIYIKLDDDICYVEPDAIEALIDFRIMNPGYFLVYPNIVNTSLMSHLHQVRGVLKARRELFTYSPFCETGWQDGRSAALVHAEFLDRLERSDLNAYKFERWLLRKHERHSINCIVWFGADFAPFSGLVEGTDDEQWLAVVKPQQLGRLNCVCGSVVMAHFAYYTQRRYLEGHTDFLERYRKLAGMVDGQHGIR